MCLWFSWLMMAGMSRMTGPSSSVVCHPLICSHGCLKFPKKSKTELLKPLHVSALLLSQQSKQITSPLWKGGEIDSISRRKEWQSHFAKVHASREGTILLPFFRLPKSHVQRKGTWFLSYSQGSCGSLLSHGVMIRLSGKRCLCSSWKKKGRLATGDGRYETVGWRWKMVKPCTKRAAGRMEERGLDQECLTLRVNNYGSYHRLEKETVGLEIEATSGSGFPVSVELSMLPPSCGQPNRHVLKRILLHVLFHCGLSQGIEYSSLCSTSLFIHPTYNSLHLLTPDSQSIHPSPTPQPSLSKSLPPSLLFTLSWRPCLLIHQENEVNGEAPTQLPSSSFYSPSSFLTYLHSHPLWLLARAVWGHSFPIHG